MSENWSVLEIELILADYFSMLEKELTGAKLNKTEHRKRLLKLLPNRKAISLEFKHRNISAVLAENNYPYIKGYLPAYKYQRKSVNFPEMVLNFIRAKKNIIESTFDLFLIEKPLEIVSPKFENWLEPPPEKSKVSEPLPNYFRPIKVNYLEKEQRSRHVGYCGEELVYNYEKWNLINQGKSSLAERIEWISKEKGDGAGFDILSKNANGTDKYIEVKSTKLTKETPIFFSKTEYEFSKLKSKNYWLYRVFDIQHKPKMFHVKGKFDDFCAVEVESYKGHF